MIAADENHTDIVKMLIDYGAAVALRSKVCHFSGSDETVIFILLRTDVYYVSNILQTGLTALDLAKTQDIRELLQEQFAKEGAKLAHQQQNTENQEGLVKVGSPKLIDSQANKEFTNVGEPL